MKLDLLITNAHIITLDVTTPEAHSMGIWAGRIVGFDDDVADLPAHTRLDLAGATVVPGFNDAHTHTAWYGLTLSSIDVENLPGGLPEVYARIEVEAAKLSSEDWILATGYSHHDYEGHYPDLAVLDHISQGRPLFMRQVSGHAAIVNTRAMELAGILDPNYHDVPGGTVVRDSQGKPTGLIEEQTQNEVQNLIRPYSLDTLVHAIDLATTRYAAEGITSFTDAGVGAGWISHSPVEIAAFQRARSQEKLRARAQLMPTAEALHTLQAHRDDSITAGLDLGILSGFGDDYLSLGAVKFFLDGALSSRTAALTEPYENSDSAGYFHADPAEVAAEVHRIYTSGWAVALHAIGDAAVEEALRILGQLPELDQVHTIPNRIEHAGVVQEKHLPLFAQHKIAVTPQAAFADRIGDAMNTAVGSHRRDWLYRARSFLDHGVLLAGSSDRPCAEGSPLRGIQAFVDRRTRTGNVFGAAAESITAAEALVAYTVGSAHAAGQAHAKGSLTPGKLADCTVLADNPLTCPPEDIKNIQVLATLVGGEFTHTLL